MSEMFLPDAFGFSWLNRSAPPKSWDNAVMREKWLRSGRPSMQTYLDTVQSAFPWARILRLHGRSMENSHYGAKHDLMEQGKCYGNAIGYRIFQVNRGVNHFAYAEGLYMGHHIPMLHAWNMLGDYVFDGTYGADSYARYFGVVFEDDFLKFMDFVLSPGKWKGGHGIFANIAHTGPYVQNYCRLRHFA